MNEESDSENKPIPKPEPSKGGAGVPPKPTAVGTGGSGDKGDFSPGEEVLCEIVFKNKLGYSVISKKNNLPGYFVTTNSYKDGQSIGLKFIKWDGKTVVFAEFSNKPVLCGGKSSARWTNEELDIRILMILEAERHKRSVFVGANPRMIIECLDKAEVRLVEKRLWNLKKQGYIVFSNRLFIITKEGQEFLQSQAK